MSGEEQKQRHGEDEQQRRNREVIELLNELRVALPGVQVLFAFLLIVPFSQGFSSVTAQQRYVYFATLLCTGVSAALLIAPSSHHRLLWRQHAREERLKAANRLSIGGGGLPRPGDDRRYFLDHGCPVRGCGGSGERCWARRGVRMVLVRAAAAYPTKVASLLTHIHKVRGETVRKVLEAPVV